MTVGVGTSMQMPPLRDEGGVLSRDFDQEYCSGVFSDELDLLGLRGQVACGLLPNRRDLRCFGQVRTIRLAEAPSDDERIELGLGFLGNLNPGDILVVQGSQHFAYFGELMTRLALRGKVGGVIVEGLTRDSAFTQHTELPIFARGYSPVDIKGRGQVAAVDEEVRVGTVVCRPGDWVFADADAAVFLPAEHSELLLRRVREAVAHEQHLKEWIDQGWSVSEILKRTKGF